MTGYLVVPKASVRSGSNVISRMMPEGDKSIAIASSINDVEKNHRVVVKEMIDEKMLDFENDRLFIYKLKTRTNA